MKKEKTVRAVDAENNVIRRTTESLEVEEEVKRQEKEIAFCDCGNPIDEPNFRCSNCEDLLCLECTIDAIEGKLCPDCVRTKYVDLDLVDYKILRTIAEGGVFTTDTPFGLSLEEFRQRRDRLRSDLFVKKRFRWSITTEGEKTYRVYRQLYGEGF